MWDKLAKLNPPPAVRRWLYGLSIPAIPLLTYYGWVNDTSAPLWAAVVAAALNGTIASANVSDG